MRCDSSGDTVPLNNKETMQQRAISLDREDSETGMEGLEEPLKAKKRRESRQGIHTHTDTHTYVQPRELNQISNTAVVLYTFLSCVCVNNALITSALPLSFSASSIFND